MPTHKKTLKINGIEYLFDFDRTTEENRGNPNTWGRTRITKCIVWKTIPGKGDFIVDKFISGRWNGPAHDKNDTAD